MTRTQIKLPPSSLSSDLCTSPTNSQILSATFLVIYLMGILWTWTQNVAIRKTRSWIGESLTYLCRITKCLSKLYGWFWFIFSISSWLLKTKRTICFPIFWIRKPLFVLQICFNIFATTFIFRKQGVKNFTAKMNSWNHWSLWRTKCFPYSHKKEPPTSSKSWTS